MGLFLKYRLEVAVFITGASVMIFELIGSRFLAPYFGGSIFVWTALIGIIMASLSLGYYFGGILSDMKINRNILSDIIIFASILMIIMNLIREPVLIFILNSFALEFGSIVASALLFGPASIALGMVSPYATRLKLEESKKTGTTIGSVYAISTAGSILGTFATGFLLLPLLGSRNIIYLLVVVLFLASLLISLKSNKALLVTGILLLIFSIIIPKQNKYLVDTDTNYSRTWLAKEIDSKTNKEIITLSQDINGSQSAIFVNSEELVFEYTKFYRLASLFNPNLRKVLMIGGAGYSYPKDFLKNNQESEITVVEIDPKVTEIAKKYFRLRDNKRLKIIHQDGRFYLNLNKEKYDAILVDAFGTTTSPPFQLTTKEALQKESAMLMSNGVIIVNIISSLEGEFFKSEYATYKEVFKNVYVFGVESKDKNVRQNLILIATNGEIPSDVRGIYKEYLDKMIMDDIKKGKVLTDDFAPVDFLVELN